MKSVKDAFPFVMFPLIVLLFEVAACQPSHSGQQRPTVVEVEWQDVTPPREDLQCWMANPTLKSRAIVCVPKTGEVAK